MPLNLNHMSAALRVCVDKAEEGRISGRVYSQRLTKPVSFTDVGSLLLQVEEVLNKQNFPQAFQRTRTFVRRKDDTGVPAAASLEDAMSVEEVAAARGEVTTFLIYVITRRSTTWQGRVDWLDGSPSEEFSSVLELIKLTDQRILH